MDPARMSLQMFSKHDSLPGIHSSVRPQCGRQASGNMEAARLRSDSGANPAQHFGEARALALHQQTDAKNASRRVDERAGGAERDADREHELPERRARL